MTTPTKVHCFFEQSGTFKNEFRKLGIPAEDYDIQNNFGETDHVIDLFAEIEKGYDGKPSVFDEIGNDDLIMAFFPCIYFCNIAELNQKQGPIGSHKWSKEKLWTWRLDYSRKRQLFYERALKLTALVELRGLRMIAENPWHEINYTNHFWFNRPSIIDRDRTRRGDYFVKPTAYWFINCEPTHGRTHQQTRDCDIRFVGAGGHNNAKFRASHEKQRLMTANGSGTGGVCSEERSMISTDYARNFIADFILGRPLGGRPQQQDLFAQKEGAVPCS